MTRKILVYPYLLWAIIFIIVPLLLIVYYSFTQFGTGSFTLANFIRVFEPTYVNVMINSISLAFKSTVICFIIGYPAAYIMAEKDLNTKSALLFLFVVPMWMNLLLRTYAWLTILENNGLINSFLAFVGLPKLELLYTEGAVILGMVYNFLPFMILPIYTVLKKMNKSIIEAAEDLGADSINVFFRVVLPLSVPGIMSGVTMVFMPAVTTFIISNLLGGGQFILIGNLIERQFLQVGDWHLGSALSVVLMVIVLISMAIFSIFDREEEGGGLF